jgi:pimeloyl-ACP methyl ester carboxylesterase
VSDRGGLTRYVRDGLTFDVQDGGEDGGEAAVLLHGFPQDRTCWDAVSRQLQAAGLRTLAPDQRGYSPGARPRGRAAYRLSECVLDVVALLDAAGLRRAHVVGHDWGGAVAWALGAQHPERVTSLTVLSTPHSRALAQAATRSAQGLRLWYFGLFQLPALPEALLRRGLGRTLRASGLPPAYTQRYAERMAAPGALEGALAWYRAAPLSLREPARRVAVPTTYVWGRSDPALGRTAAEHTRDFVLGPYRFVELDAGHWLPETRPTEVATVVLDQVRAAAA